MGLYDYVIYAGIIATTRVPLITSFQPPLGCRGNRQSRRKVQVRTGLSVSSLVPRPDPTLPEGKHGVSTLATVCATPTPKNVQTHRGKKNDHAMYLPSFIS